MMKAPEVQVTDRLFVTVDRSFRGGDHTLITTTRYSDQTLRVLNTMIPECLHLYGMEANRWFTPNGLMAFQDIQWDPVTHATTSAHDEVLADMVDENFFGMGSIWKEPVAPNPMIPHFEGIATTVTETATTVRDILDARVRGGIHDDTSSFGGVFGRSHTGSTIAPPPHPTTTSDPNGTTSNQRRVGFSMDSSEQEHAEPTTGDEDASVSTLGTEATTGSTRRQLRHQVDLNLALRNEGLQMAATLERLEARLAAHGITADESSHDTMTTQEHPSAIRGNPSAAADSAGGYT